MTTVTIFHNIATDEVGRSVGMLDGYSDGHPLVPVYRYAEADYRADTMVLEAAFETFNIGEGGHAAPYREARNRSLSVGDVISIDDGTGESSCVRYYACAPFGWRPINTPKWFARNASAHGTTPLPRVR